MVVQRTSVPAHTLTYLLFCRLVCLWRPVLKLFDEGRVQFSHFLQSFALILSLEQLHPHSYSLLTTPSQHFTEYNLSFLQTALQLYFCLQSSRIAYDSQPGRGDLWHHELHKDRASTKILERYGLLELAALRMVVRYDDLINSLPSCSLYLKLHQTPYLLAFLHSQCLPSLLDLYPILFDALIEWLSGILSAFHVEAQLSDKAIVLPMQLMELLVVEQRVCLIGKLRALERGTHAAELKNIKEVGELSIIRGAVLRGKWLTGRKEFCLLVFLFRWCFLLSLGKQFAAGSHYITGGGVQQTEGGVLRQLFLGGQYYKIC